MGTDQIKPKSPATYLLAVVVTVFGLVALIPRWAAAGTLELSIGGSFSQNTYALDNYTWTRHWGASVGYHFSELSSLEFSFTDTFDRTKLDGFEDTSVDSQVFSVEWVQAFTDRNFPLQPYIKAGIGQLDQSASGSYFGGVAPPAIFDQVTAIVGVGLRIYITHHLALRGEATDDLTDLNINDVWNNFNVSFGISIFL